MKFIELKPIRTPQGPLDEVEEKIIEVFRREVYMPLLEAFDREPATLQNAAKTALMRAIDSGKVIVDISTGRFDGDFTAAVSKELQAMGAKWRPHDETWSLRPEELTSEIREAVARSDAVFRRALQRCDDILAKMLPADIADRIRVSDIFDSTLHRLDRQLLKTLPTAITVPPQLTGEQRAKIAAEWQNNMDRWISGFAASEIKRLRKAIQKSAFQGKRWQTSVKEIQRSFGVTRRKAEFLAQQETALLIAKFKEARYTDAGSHEYRWSCVHMPKDTSPSHHTPGNVRYSHGILDGTIQRWDSPPVTTAPGQPVRRNHPGEDFRCRCIAIPRVSFKASSG